MSPHTKEQKEIKVLVACKIEKSWSDMLDAICKNTCRTRSSLLREAIKNQIIEGKKI